MSKTLRALVSASVLVVGCVSGQLIQSAPQKTPEEWFNDRWVGKPEDDVLVQYGQPTDVLHLHNGNHVNSYHREIAVAGSSSVITGYGGSSRSESTTIYCDRRFEIDKDTLKVVRAVITGSQCDYAR